MMSFRDRALWSPHAHNGIYHIGGTPGASWGSKDETVPTGDQSMQAMAQVMMAELV